MQLGMYSIELQRPSIEALFQAIRGYGFTQVQFDFASVCEEQMPAQLEPGLLQSIYREAQATGVEIIAVNGTFNMIHPDAAARAEGCRRFAVIAGACSYLHCNFVTLCTGSRDPDNMWRWHADNQAPEAWRDLIQSMRAALEVAERYDLLLGIECEASNCINSAEQARRLLDEFRSPRLKIIMDVANLFQRGEAHPENVRRIMDHAFTLLGNDLHLAHGKDILEGEGLAFTHAGNGIVDFDHYLELLRASAYTGGMLLHGIKDERYFLESVAFAQEVIARHGA
jgi:sugar phosphate isomerase/epimerase